MDNINWKHEKAAIWRSYRKELRPVRRLDPVSLDALLGIDRQKQLLCDNTERFLNNQPANHALLWGSRGTGKSSLIKALLNQYADDGLRMIEVDQDDLDWLPEIIDSIYELRQKFVIFCDDLSFEPGDSRYKPLKSILEGSLELPPENVLLYASSNRRHLVCESSDNSTMANVVGTELHYGDTVEEQISLSDRFGLWLSFYPISQPEYLNIVDYLFCDWSGDRETLHHQAIRFAQGKGVRSGRVARQFFNSIS